MIIEKRRRIFFKRKKVKHWWLKDSWKAKSCSTWWWPSSSSARRSLLAPCSPLPEYSAEQSFEVLITCLEMCTSTNSFWFKKKSYLRLDASLYREVSLSHAVGDVCPSGRERRPGLWSFGLQWRDFVLFHAIKAIIFFYSESRKLWMSHKQVPG